MKKLFTFFSLTLILLAGAGCQKPTEPVAPADLALAEKAQLPAAQNIEHTPFFSFANPKKQYTYQMSKLGLGDILTAESLTNQNARCDSHHSYSYYQALMKKFHTGEIATRFTFDSWIVTVVPNRPGYTKLADFQSDFAVCGPYGDLFPAQISPQYLLFTSVCPTGVADNKKAEAAACAKARDELAKTIELK